MKILINTVPVQGKFPHWFSIPTGAAPLLKVKMGDQTGRDPDMVLLSRLQKDLRFKQAEVNKLREEIRKLEDKLYSVTTYTITGPVGSQRL